MSTDRDLNTLYAAVGRAMSAWETLEANFSYLYSVLSGARCRRKLSFIPCRFRNRDSSIPMMEPAKGSDAQQRLRTARVAVCRARPSRAKRAFASHDNRSRISQGFVDDAPRWTRSNDQRTRTGRTRSSVQHVRSARASGTRWACPGCPWLARRPASPPANERASRQAPSTWGNN